MSPSHHHLPKRVFPVPYQVDFSVELNGRHVDSTKRRLTWKVGFAHPPSVFPHLFDADENYVEEDVATGDDEPKRGIECRGREHEIILTWSVLTGKAHIYVDSREIIRHEPLDGSIFSTFTGSFHRGFDLPNSKYNGRHRIDIRCYARTPMGAKGMSVDAMGGKFRQYDLSVDGLSFFNMPAVYELGTPAMWNKVSRWGLNRTESSSEEEIYQGGGGARRQSENGDFERRGRIQDEYYFEKAKRKSEMVKYGQSISNSEIKAMNPRSESEEERMMRIAMEASLQDWEKDAGYRKPIGRSLPRHEGATRPRHSGSREENNGASCNRQKSIRRGKKQSNGGNNLSAIGEDDNLIGFDVDDASKAISHINISRQTTDVSVLGDDDATTASFMMNTAWNSGAPKQPVVPAPQQLYGNQQPKPYHDRMFNQQPTPHYDPTFRAQFAQQPWSSVGTISSPSSGMGLPSSDASFAVPPPPTWDDYNDAFGGSTRNLGATSVMGGPTVMTNPMSPASTASVGMASPTAPPQQQMPQYGMLQQAPAFGIPSGGYGFAVGGPYAGVQSAQMGNANKFDPLRANPFSS